METGSTSTHPIVPKSPVVLCLKKRRTSELPRAHCSGSARSQRSMAIVVRAPTCGIEDLLSSPTEKGTGFGLAKHPKIEEGRSEVLLGWPFTVAEQCRPTLICLSSREAAQVIVALEAALRRLSALPSGTTLMDVSTLALSHCGPGICRRESVDAETSAMQEVVRAYTVGGGVWPGTGLRVFQPIFAKAPLMERVLVHLRDCGEGGQAVLDALGGCLVVGSPSASASMLLLCTQTGTDASPLPLEEAPTSIVNTVDEALDATSETFGDNGGRSSARTMETVSENERNPPVSFSEVEVTSKSPTTGEVLAQDCLHAASTLSSKNVTCEGSYNMNISRDAIAAGSPATPEDEPPSAEKPTRDCTVDPRSAEASAQQRDRFDTTSVFGSLSTPSNSGGGRLCILPWSPVSEERRPNGAKSATSDHPVVAIANAQTNAPHKPFPSSEMSTHHKAVTTLPPAGRSRVELDDILEDKPSASCGGGPQDTSFTAASPESGAVPPFVDPALPPRSPTRSMSLRQARMGGRCQVGAAGGEADENGNRTSPSATQRRRRRSPMPPRSPVPSGGERNLLTLDTAVATTSRQRSAAASPTGAAVVTPPTSSADAVESKMPSAASPGRRRVPSSPRGRPSCSPGRSPSRSPARSRGSTTASPPRASQRNVAKGNLATAESSLLFRPPPPDLQQSCYDNMGGSPGFLGDNSRVGGAFWGRGSVRCSSSIHHMMAMKAMLSTTPQKPLSNERNTSTASSSALDQDEEEVIVLEGKTAQEEEEEEAAAATATAAADRKAARRVTWAPIVIARDEAAAVIRPFMQRYAEAEVQECRVAHSDREKRMFIERRAEQERGQGRRPAIALPAAQRGAFFGLLSGLSKYRSTWRKYQDFVIMENTVTPFIPMGLTRNQLAAWGIGSGGGGGSGCAMAGKQASGASAPPGPANLGEVVRKMATDLLNGGA